MYSKCEKSNFYRSFYYIYVMIGANRSVHSHPSRIYLKPTFEGFSLITGHTKIYCYGTFVAMGGMPLPRMIVEKDA